MTHEEQKEFTDQVIEVIQRQNASEDYNYYGHFINECQKYGLSQADFNKQILSVASRSYTGPVEPTSGPNTVLFGTRCFSIKKMGEVFFNNPAKCEDYMADAAFFREDVRSIEKADRSMELLAVFNSEKAVNRRYIRVTYHFNPSLPYRVGSDLSENIEALLLKGFQDHAFYKQIVQHYTIGFLQIWLEETNKRAAALLDGGTGYDSFLKFIYALNKAYPFYIEDELFGKPADLVVKAQKELAFRETLFEFMVNEQLPIWFEAIGHSNWNSEYEVVINKIDKLANLDDDDKIMAAAQSLIYIIDGTAPVAKIVSGTSKITLLSVEASKNFEQPVVLKLENVGIVKGAVSLSKSIEGIKIDNQTVSFNSFANETITTITITIEPAKLQKDNIYKFNFVVSSLKDTLTIPVELKVVFPIKAYSGILIKYGVFVAAFFVLIKYLLSTAINNTTYSYYYSSPHSFATTLHNLPYNYYGYVIIPVLFLCGLFGISFISKKIEKI